MSYSKHPLDDIHVGDYVVLEVTVSYVGEEPYVYTVSGTVRKYDGVKCVGINGIGGEKIIEHRPRPLPTAFASHIRYANGAEWVKTTGDWWRSDTGTHRESRQMPPGWVLVRDAGAKP